MYWCTIEKCYKNKTSLIWNSEIPLLHSWASEQTTRLHHHWLILKLTCRPLRNTHNDMRKYLNIWTHMMLMLVCEVSVSTSHSLLQLLQQPLNNSDYLHRCIHLTVSISIWRDDWPAHAHTHQEYITGYIETLYKENPTHPRPLSVTCTSVLCLRDCIAVFTEIYGCVWSHRVTDSRRMLLLRGFSFKHHEILSCLSFKYQLSLRCFRYLGEIKTKSNETVEIHEQCGAVKSGFE